MALAGSDCWSLGTVAPRPLARAPAGAAPARCQRSGGRTLAPAASGCAASGALPLPVGAAGATVVGGLVLQRRRGRGRRRRRAPCARAVVAAATVDEAIQQRLEELRGLRARELRRRLEELGVSTAGCVDKDSLLEVLEALDRSLLLVGSPAQAAPAEVAPAETAPAEPAQVEAEPVEAELVEAEPVEAEPIGAQAAQEQGAAAPPEPELPQSEDDWPEEVRERMEQLRGMRLRDLRKELASLGLRTEGCVDRESITELLEREGPAAVQRAQKAKKEPYTGGFNIPQIPKTPACSPQFGKSEVPIYMASSVDQYGVKAGATKVITLDVECGTGVERTRFVLDTVSEHSLIRAKVAAKLGGQLKGVPDWAEGTDPEMQIRTVSLLNCWLGKLNCGNLQVASIVGKLPVPNGVAGILGLDFLRLFDWDIDFKALRAKVRTAPSDGLGPVPFDLAGMRVVPLTPVRTPMELLACPIKMRLPGKDVVAECMGIADLGASCTMCNAQTAHKLGLVGPPEPYKPRQAPPKKAAGKKGFSAPEPEPAFQKQRLQVDIGVGPDGPVRVETDVSFGDIEVFETMGLSYNYPAAILGPDTLCRSRLVMSPRLKSVWLPASN